MIFVPYVAVSYGQEVEEISKSSKTGHCNILERHKVLNHGIKLENKKKRRHLESSVLGRDWY